MLRLEVCTQQANMEVTSLANGLFTILIEYRKKIFSFGRCEHSVNRSPDSVPSAFFVLPQYFHYLFYL